MQVTLIRHLPTDWNNKTWLQGRRDIPISPVSEVFMEGILKNKEKLIQSEPFDLILSSSLCRTQQTARLYGYRPKEESLLDELDFGPFEGRPKIELFEHYGNRWMESPQTLVLGEPVKQLKSRIVLFLEKYREYGNLLVFGHGAWMRAMKSLIEFGNIQHMNKMLIENNQMMTIHIPSQKEDS